MSSTTPLNPITLLQELLCYESITPNECGIYTRIKEIFAPLEGYFYTRIIEQEKKGVKNLFYLFDALDSKNLESRVHFCFAGHIDVVPPGEGWTHKPFSGKIIHDKGEEYVYGRGAQDMKGGVSAFICAMYEFLSAHINKPLPYAISLLLTSDEEGDGIYGTRLMLERLRDEALLPHACIVAEPTATHTSGDMIKIGRRGSINGILTIYGKQGHVAYPEKCLNPIELLGSKLGDLAGAELDSGNEFFAPSKLVITDIRGGMEVVNVTPQSLKIMFNVRNSPLSNEQSLRAFIESKLGKACEKLESTQDLAKDTLSYTLTLKTSSLPFISHANSPLVETLRNAIKQARGFETECSTSGGTSDARFFAAYGVQVVELGVPNDTIHAINERVKVADMYALCEIFKAFLQLFAQGRPSNALNP